MHVLAPDVLPQLAAPVVKAGNPHLEVLPAALLVGQRVCDAPKASRGCLAACGRLQGDCRNDERHYGQFHCASEALA
jgi:hypothetical protein